MGIWFPSLKIICLYNVRKLLQKDNWEVDKIKIFDLKADLELFWIIFWEKSCLSEYFESEKIKSSRDFRDFILFCLQGESLDNIKLFIKENGTQGFSWNDILILGVISNNFDLVAYSISRGEIKQNLAAFKYVCQENNVKMHDFLTKKIPGGFCFYDIIIKNGNVEFLNYIFNKYQLFYYRLRNYLEEAIGYGNKDGVYVLMKKIFMMGFPKGELECIYKKYGTFTILDILKDNYHDPIINLMYKEIFFDRIRRGSLGEVKKIIWKYREIIPSWIEDSIKLARGKGHINIANYLEERCWEKIR